MRTSWSFCKSTSVCWLSIWHVRLFCLHSKCHPRPFLLFIVLICISEPWGEKAKSLTYLTSTLENFFQNFFLDALDVCENCPSKKARPAKTHYHCLCCHKNYIPTTRIASYLKGHVLKNDKVSPAPNCLAHDLNKPPRQFQVTCFADLTEEEKTLVREGMMIIDQC